MNILLVNSAARELWGGGEKWFVSAAEWFAAHGHPATLVARPESKLEFRAQDRSVPTVRCEFGGDFDPIAVLKALRIIRQTKADVVLTNFNKEAWQFGSAARLIGIPVVARHGFTLWSNKLRHKFLARQIITHLIVNARSIADSYRAMGFKPRQVSVIHNGVTRVTPKPGFLRRQLGIGDDELLVIAAGRLETQKRFDRLLGYSTKLKSDQGHTLVIFGTGPEEQRLLEMRDALGLGNTVVFRGFDPDFAHLVGDADLFLLTSDDEGNPNVVLEAMSAGVPVLAFEVGAMNEILGGELNEFLVQAGDDGEFVSKLIELAQNREALRMWRSLFEKRAQREFSLDASMQKYFNVLTEALA